MKTAQDRYFECLEVCIEDEQGKSCRQVCAPILNDAPYDHPTVPLINNMVQGIWMNELNAIEDSIIRVIMISLLQLNLSQIIFLHILLS